MSSFSFLNVLKFNFKNKRAEWLYRALAMCAISKLLWYNNLKLTTNLHQLKNFSPTRDNATKWELYIITLVKLLTINKCSYIRSLNCIINCRSSTCTLSDYLISKTTSSSFYSSFFLKCGDEICTLLLVSAELLF